MKKIVLSLALVVSLVAVASAETRKAPPVPAQNPTFVEIEKTLGFVPEFFKGVPQTLLPAFWSSLTGLQLNPATKLDGKTKELIGLAVAAQIPCEYCVYFHTEAAKLNGATDEEVKEAVAMAGVTRLASTILNGTQTDKAQFKKDTQRIIEGARRAKK
ncbi:MAG TPA: carboxymuconolactone decarboxylase family protein [Kofleriaceae bacterium]|nr:carboxymuconolactone decarboxylase family protein [Kofleriaceae bacterium]